MDEQRKNTKRFFRILEGVVLAVVVAYIVYSIVVLKKPGPLYPVLIAGGILLVWLLELVLSPLKSGDFEGKTPEQMTAYRKYAAMSLVGYAGLIYFALSTGSNMGIYGAVVYVVTVMGKRRFFDEYVNGRKVEDTGEDADVTDAEDALLEDASGREERMRAAQEEAPDMRSKVEQLNTLAEETEEMHL